VDLRLRLRSVAQGLLLEGRTKSPIWQALLPSNGREAIDPAPKDSQDEPGGKWHEVRYGLILGKDEIEQIDTRVLAFPLPGEGPTTTVAVIVEIDGGDLIVDDPRTKLDLEFHAYAIDPNGGVQDLLMQHVRLAKKTMRPPQEKRGVRFLGALEIPAGSYRVRILMQEGDRMTLATTLVDLEPAGRGAPVLLPLLFAPREEEWLVVREEVRPGKTRPEESLFLATGDHFVPVVVPAVNPQSELPFVFSVFGGERSRLTAWVVDGEGVAVEGWAVEFSSRRRAPRGAGTAIGGQLRIEGLPPGRYHLEIGVLDGDDGAPRTLSSAFRVTS
jgi:hypothetical protein